MAQSSHRKRTLLITGGLGFIGSKVVEALRGTYDISIIDWNRSRPHLDQFREWGIEVVQEDISDAQTWKSVPPCDFVLHAAGQVSAEDSKEDPALDFQTNAMGTLRVAEYARKHEPGVLYCNSIRVYSPEAATAAVRTGPAYAVAEDCPLISEQNIWDPPFAVSKLIGEQYLRYYSTRYGFPVVSFRMSGIVGTGQQGNPRHAWIAYLVECAVNNKLYQVFGDGGQSRDILHIDDFVSLIQLVLANFGRKPAKGFSVYNVGGGPKNRITLNEAIQFLQSSGLAWPLEYASGRRDEPRDYVSSVDRVSHLGWTPRIALETIIEELVDWHRKGEGDGNRYRRRKRDEGVR